LAQEVHHLVVYRNIKGNKVGYYVHNHNLLHFLVYFYIKSHDGPLGQTCGLLLTEYCYAVNIVVFDGSFIN